MISQRVVAGLRSTSCRHAATRLSSADMDDDEHMALTTVERVSDEFEPLIVAPQGSALQAAGRRGYGVVAFKDLLD